MLDKKRVFMSLSLIVAMFLLVACGSDPAEESFTTVTSDAGFTIDLP